MTARRTVVPAAVVLAAGLVALTILARRAEEVPSGAREGARGGSSTGARGAAPRGAIPGSDRVASVTGRVFRTGRPSAAAVTLVRLGEVPRPGFAWPVWTLLATGETADRTAAGADGAFSLAAARSGAYRIEARAGDGAIAYRSGSFPPRAPADGWSPRTGDPRRGFPCGSGTPSGAGARTDGFRTPRSSPVPTGASPAGGWCRARATARSSVHAGATR